MSEEHFDFLSFSTRDGVGIGLGDRTGLVTSGFVNGSRNLACEHIRTALGFEHAGVAVVLSGAIADRAVSSQPLSAVISRGGSSHQVMGGSSST